MHGNTFLAHFENHVQRVLLRIVENFNQSHEVVVIELLHDRNFLLDQAEGVVSFVSRLFAIGAEVERRIEAQSSSDVSWSSSGVRFSKQIRLRSLAQSRLGELFDSLCRPY